MIAARQIAFGKAAGAKKPYDAEIEYLESTGTQYIDTGLDFDSGDWACDAFLTVTENLNELYIISTKLTGVGGLYSFAYMNGTQIRLAYSSNIAAIKTVSDDFFSQGFVWKSRFTNGSQTLEVGEYKLSANQQFKALTNPEAYSIIIGGAVTLGSKGKGVRFGEIKIYHNSILVRDFIPVRVGSVGYMYDRVSGQLFGNQGTGEFVLGPDIIDYTAKDYIQDGLVAMWDGIENGGYGIHNEGVGFDWVSCVGGMTLPANNVRVFYPDGIGMNTTFGFGTITIPSEFSSLTEWTIEMLVDFGVAEDSNSFLRGNQSSLTYYPHILRYKNSTEVIAGSNDFITMIDNPDNAVSYAAFRMGDTHNVLVAIGSGDFVSHRGKESWGALGITGFKFSDPNEATGRLSRFKSIRCYSRPITNEELEYNRNIDKARFGL